MALSEIVAPMTSRNQQRLCWNLGRRAGTIKDIGKVLGALKSQYAGRMDFARASAIVKARLTS